MQNNCTLGLIFPTKKMTLPFASTMYYGGQEKESEKSKEEFLTREETAKLCRVKSLTTLWNWAKKGILSPALQSGRKPLYRKADVINFLEGKGGNND